MATNAGVTDTFSSFVETVARNLDESDGSIRSDGLAAQAFMSRSQFDRVIRAAAGEPPGAFRRRVLLERAAFRLATTSRGILDIALEAGYSSHEAFVRAFKRAYGVNPSDWRGSPRQIRLPTPNDVHFHPPGGLRLPTKTEMTSMDLLLRLVEHHVWLTGALIDRAAKLDDKTLDKPIAISVEGIDDDPTIRSLLSRLVGQMDMWNNAMQASDYSWELEQHETIPHMRTRLSRVGDEYLAEVRRVVSEGRLDETFVDTT